MKNVAVFGAGRIGRIHAGNLAAWLRNPQLVTEHLRPGAISWPVTRTSVIPVDRSGAGAGSTWPRDSSSRMRRRLQKKLLQATGEMEWWRALSP